MRPDSVNQLLKALEKMHANYDPNVQLLRSKVGTLGYHTQLKTGEPVHLTRESLSYALALLDSELPENLIPATEVIQRVIGLQDTDRSSPTFGIWPWYFEEPLEKMAPPDWNWADFCGHRLILTVIRHEARLDEPIKSSIKQAAFNACDAIIKRNVGPGYTNIAILGACVTLLAGEHYKHSEYLDYGLQRLQRFSEHTRRLGTFEEFNSPTYTLTAITDLSSIHTYTSNEEARSLANEMLEVAWKLVAEHFHPATGQWGGPHARSYSTLLRHGTLSFLQNVLGETVKLIGDEEFEYSPDWYKNEIQCPAHLWTSFVEKGERSLRQLIAYDAKNGIEKRAATESDLCCSIGSFNREVMWNQRRNLVAYIDNQGSPTYLHLRFLRNGYDYSSAVFTSVQEQRNVLFGINFSTNGGNTHIGLDRIDGTVDASDLRLRVEIGGCLQRVHVKEVPQPAHDLHTGSQDLKPSPAYCVAVGEYAVGLKNHFAAFDAEHPYWEVNKTEDHLHLDFVLYSGANKRFDFRKMEQALLVFSCSLDREVHFVPVSVQPQEGLLSASMKVGEHLRSLSLLLSPATTTELFQRNAIE